MAYDMNILDGIMEAWQVVERSVTTYYADSQRNLDVKFKALVDDIRKLSVGLNEWKAAMVQAGLVQE